MAQADPSPVTTVPYNCISLEFQVLPSLKPGRYLSPRLECNDPFNANTARFHLHIDVWLGFRALVGLDNYNVFMVMMLAVLTQSECSLRTHQ